MIKLRKDTNQILIETMIRRTMHDISRSPERSIRNLIDLALNFSNGRFQRNFLETAQGMLRNKKSAYYELLKNALADIDHDTISSFGINLGYNSCTKGAKRIRSVEAEEGFNIPWSLTFVITPDSWALHRDRYIQAVSEGKDLGIFTYLFFLSGSLPGFTEFLAGNPDCAFILFCRPEDLTCRRLRSLEPFHNVMISVDTAQDFLPACQRLCERKFLYACHTSYSRENRLDILSGSWIDSVMPLKPSFLFIHPAIDRSLCVDQELWTEIYAYVTDIRNRQLYPAFLMDLFGDNLVIDRIISDSGCLAVFGQDGGLMVYKDGLLDCDMNMFTAPLHEIFQSVLSHA